MMEKAHNCVFDSNIGFYVLAHYFWLVSRAYNFPLVKATPPCHYNPAVSRDSYDYVLMSVRRI